MCRSNPRTIEKSKMDNPTRTMSTTANITSRLWKTLRMDLMLSTMMESRLPKIPGRPIYKKVWIQLTTLHFISGAEERFISYRSRFARFFTNSFPVVITFVGSDLEAKSFQNTRWAFRPIFTYNVFQKQAACFDSSRATKRGKKNSKTFRFSANSVFHKKVAHS